MRLSRILFPSLKEVPKEAVIKSHVLMLRAGLIRKLASGLYSYLPLGLRSFRKVERIVREEMDAAGGQEFSLPILTPGELWQQSGRWSQFGPELVRIQDRHETWFALGPTHEEVFTQIAKTEIFSYKQLPVTFYQIKTKFRDEIRPRFGVMRCREFTMKDAYSFDLDAASLDESYRKMRQAYINIFRRCGLKTKIVAADTGAMGGSDSEEFMVESEVGEDSIASCTACSYAANVERAEARYGYAAAAGTAGQMEKVDTPGVKSIEALTKFLGVEPAGVIKTILYKADKKPVAAVIRGDLEINEKKLMKALAATELELADPAAIMAATSGPVGFSGPVGLKGKITVVADESARHVLNAVAGANEKDRHLKNVNIGRDWDADSFHDLRLVKAGDACPLCGKPLSVSRGIEVGHIFKLGDKYTKSIGFSVLDKDSRQIVPTMGCYGIGVDRTLAAVVEQFSDTDGIAFPASVAPFEVIITPVDFIDDSQRKTAEGVYEGLLSAGVEVLLDDRDERAGSKFKDADLMGIPLRVTIGPKFLKEGKLELRLRGRKETLVCEIPSAVDKVRSILKEMREGL